MKLSGRYYDGQSAQTLMVEAEFTMQGLKVRNNEYAHHEITISPKLGSTPRFVEFPDGTRMECHPQEAIDELDRRLGQKNRVSFLEAHWLAVLSSIVVAVIFVWGSVQYGVPALAKSVAMALPEEWVLSSDEYTLEALDRTMFETSKLSESRQQELKLKFHQLKQVAETNAHLIFRSSPRGANAFALPGGTVIMTDELVELAKTDEEILSVLGHELGHIKYRHSLRHSLEASALTLVITAVTGDLTGLNSLLVNLPVILMSMSYGRELESEADDVAYDLMLKMNMDPIHFANIMERLHDGAHQGPEWLSSHPASDERVSRFKQ